MGKERRNEEEEEEEVVEGIVYVYVYVYVVSKCVYSDEEEDILIGSFLTNIFLFCFVCEVWAGKECDDYSLA